MRGSGNADRILEYLGGLTERELTTEVIKPLLSVLGYTKIEEYGGPYEKGRDMICWAADRLGDPEVAVVQVKRYKPSARSRDSTSFMELVNQLQAAAETPVPSLDGSLRRPNTVYFVTPHPVETRALETRFDGYKSLRPMPKILDGNRLALLIRTHLPTLVQRVTGRDEAIREASVKQLNDHALMLALEAKAEKDLGDLYSDLDLNVGEMTSALFGSLRLPKGSRVLSIDYKATASLLLEFSARGREQGLNVTTPEHDAMVVGLENFFSTSSVFADFRDRITQKTKYPVKIHWEVVSAHFDEQMSWLRESAAALSEGHRPSELRNFLQAAHQLLSFGELTRHVLSLMGGAAGAESPDTRPLEPVARLSIPFFEIAKSGLNLLLIGEAGAGKTTTLSMLVQQRLAGNGGSAPILFVSVAKMTNIWRQGPAIMGEGAVSSDHLLSALAAFLRSEAVSISREDLREVFREGCTLVLDGLDEGAGSAAWIAEALADLEKLFPKAQMIVSSRILGPYLSSIPFVGLQLLPFSDAQLGKFVSNWFRDEKTLISDLRAHLASYPQLAAAVHSPLLATILCVLAEHGLELPRTEVELYKVRLRLLVGDYDANKGSRRLASRRDTLLSLARALAFQLHSDNRRSALEEELATWAKEWLRGKLKEEAATVAVSELIFPCNILVPMTRDGQFGFGHLRYQEYLVAEELRRNRTIEVGPLLALSWWRGPLVFLAQLIEDVEFLMKEALETRMVTEARPTLETLAEYLSADQRGEYLGKLKRRLNAEKLARATQSQR